MGVIGIRRIPIIFWWHHNLPKKNSPASHFEFLYRSLRKFDVILTLNRNRPSRTVGEYIMITIESYLPAEYTLIFSLRQSDNLIYFTNFLKYRLGIQDYIVHNQGAI